MASPNWPDVSATRIARNPAPHPTPHGDLDPSAGDVMLQAGMRLGKLNQNQFGYEDERVRVLDVVMRGHTKLWAAMKERVLGRRTGVGAGTEVGARRRPGVSRRRGTARELLDCAPAQAAAPRQPGSRVEQRPRGLGVNLRIATRANRHTGWRCFWENRGSNRRSTRVPGRAKLDTRPSLRQ